MNAHTVAMRLTTNATTAAAIERLLGRHGFSDRECDAVLLLTDMFLEDYADAGGEVNDDVIMRAGAKATDTVWVRRNGGGGK